MISMIYSNQSFSVSLNLFFFLFLSPLSSQITMRRGYREKRNNKKKLWRHTEASMKTSLVSSKRTQRDEFNDNKKVTNLATTHHL
jgi:hypothetical protein